MPDRTPQFVGISMGLGFDEEGQGPFLKTA